ncbi:amino acid adenylation domain-containing protein [Mucilaginibacter sp. HC2]|uniref:non-ribosomal peptide synthetase n=1 Tax=Mucilaginibacter inviolabilis TaxID=2714892 RepID=UPI00140A8E2E|nr:non-ribosomal peptide synthetase [Mucilaginibacter inviolabilis]NHA02806.1 amino acid adenylation domain-containing protein [Mucilaginibacter inviolabilis]
MSEQRFSSIYTGAEFFLQDHQVLGDQILPGVTYLEMARAAGEYAGGARVTQIRDINWLQPIKVNESAVEVHISLFGTDEAIGYEIYTEAGDRQLHGQGILLSGAQPEPARHDIGALRSSLSHTEQGDSYYEKFRSVGLHYGESFQGIREISYSEESALSRIALPHQAGFVLSPGLLDSALQTCMGISLASGEQQLMLPFSVREVTIYQELPEEVWCYARQDRSGKHSGSYDLELLNASGEVLVQFTELVLLSLENNTEKTSPETTSIGMQLYTSGWQMAKSETTNQTESLPTLVLLAGGPALLADKLQEALACEVKTITASQPETFFIAIQEELQKSWQQKPGMEVQVVCTHADYLDYGFISGLLQTASQENPKIRGKVVVVDSLRMNDVEALTLILSSEQNSKDQEVRYLSGVREVKGIAPLNPIEKPNGLSIKADGVYLITGGNGGLGEHFAQHISKVSGARVVLAGRSELDQSKQALINSQKNTAYCRCDVSKAEEVTSLISTIMERYGRLDGIIHSAGVIRDSYILNKTAKEIQEVFAAKVGGAKNLDNATSSIALDFMVYCSSLAGVFGNAAQADYASANAWLDNYAHYRETERKAGKRHGQTLSINWPLWASGGMQIGAENERYMAYHYGLLPMPTSEGLDAFEKLLNNATVQGIVLYGYHDQLSALTGQASPVTKLATAAPVAVADEVLYAAAVKYLRGLLAAVLGMAEEKLKAKVHFENYGIDSIQITRLTNRLEEVFGRLPRTLFFEYRNLEELCHYFIQDHQASLLILTGLNTSKPVKTNALRIAQENKLSELANKKAVQTKSETLSKAIPNKDIAIIGISGRYPEAKNLKEFWENLKAGKDSITEIPSTRWEMTGFYDEEKGKPGKSYSKWGGFMDDIDKFDPLFFNISPREAALMDPQERLFLQTAWETIEDGGYTRTRLQEIDHDENGLDSQVGVYVGVMYEEYPLFGLEERLKGNFINPGGSPSGIANRVSYFLNLHGPSTAVDTMCSSSLTAIHLACESIQNGSCKLAIAGGVNLSVHPNKYQMLSQGGFASSTGRCESFGEGGDGYVPGEGVGAVLLKPLQQAIADGDRIYGVIKGTAVNHGGKTNGYTVPNPKAQTAVIKAAMKKAGVQAEDISYIEAHGTGTSLGDPIEVAGLSKAFGTTSKQFCSLGSVKSNIGHCESAAGISGLTKVLLQLQHRQLVPSLHSAVLNPNIDFENSPFKVQQELAAWELPNGKARIAGISGFGAGGSNAHVIIEEYTGKPATVYQNTDPVIIVLSARDSTRLQEHVFNLKKHIETYPEINIHEVAYTLQTGREAMEERLAFIAADKEELLQHLSNYLENKIQDLLTGNIRKDAPGFLLEGKAGKAYLESAINEKEGRSLAQLWTKGIHIDWNLLYTDESPSLISLPTYPFARERCWFPQSTAVSLVTASKLHPLLHSNTSNLKEQQFTSTYTGNEPFLTNHQIKGIRTLPGVAYLEIARAAAEIAVQEKITQLKDIVWYSAIQVKDIPQTVYTSLYTVSDNVEYEIYTNNGTEQLHCSGTLVTKTQAIPEKHDLAAIKTGLVHEKEGSACYDLFKAAGLEYGNSFRGIQTLYYNEDVALSKIHLPIEKEYVFTPGILDSALQTCIGIQLAEEKQEILLPFSVSEITNYLPLSEEIWCYVRKNRTSKQISSYDIDLLNTAGEVLIRFTELVLVSPDGFSTGKNDSEKTTAEMHLYTTEWQAKSIQTTDLALNGLSPLIILAGGDAALAGRLQENLASVVKVSNHDAEESFFNDVLLTVKTILPQKRAAQVIVICNNTNYYKYGCITGLLKTITQENSQVSGKLIQVDDVIFQDVEALTLILSSEQNSKDQEVRYLSGVREVKGIAPLNPIEKPNGLSIKADGVYLITGGIGGLGQHFAKHISKVSGARVVLAGRSELDQSKQAWVASQPGTTYYRCDVSKAEEVTALISTIMERYGRLDGIIHSAGVIRDSYILNKTAKEIQEVFAAKVGGAKNLDNATVGIALDFMVYCSSLAGVFGNAAQADYASANAWLDNYAHYRETERKAGKRHGQTLSINWPLWASGGMQIGAENERYMAHHYGLLPMPTSEGLDAFEKLLNNATVQGIVLYGYHDQLSALTGQPTQATRSNTTTPVADEVLYPAAVKYLRGLLATALGMVEEKLEAKVHFENYGIDSIQITRLTNLLEEVFGRLPRTLFFEYRNLEELCHYFIQDHQASLLTLTGLNIMATEQNAIVNTVQPQIQAGKNRRQRFVAIQPVNDNQNNIKDIAIIGISGRYPGANNLNEFWENLKAGKDCITTIPGERWNADEIYSLEKGQPGKSYSKWGGFMDDIDKFDPLFFNISPREAELMDPQERLFLQTVWETIEDAGYTKDNLRSAGSKNGADVKIGVYAGVMYEEYQLFGAEERLKGNFVTPAGIASSIANRVSYFFNFNGPSMAIDTMCSSSLTAIHLACRDMQAGDADIAIAGGVNISVHPNKYLMLSQGRFVSGAGRCESFGEGGDGYVPGEGVGAVLLKPLQQAVADGDRIYGVIKGTAVNHGGKTNGYTVPNPKAQTAVIKAAMKKAGVQAEDISYIEAHGTGTSLGDPIEVAGLSKAFETISKQFCSLGSVKSNIGHCESAAGISGLTKVLLQLQHRQLVPSLHSAVLNPNIDFENSPFKVQQELAAWESPNGKARIAGISGFGAGGSNAHVIIEEYQPAVTKLVEYPLQAIIVLSAKQHNRIKLQVTNLVQFLESHPGSKLHDVAYTLQNGREAMDERLAFVTDSIDHLLSQLKAFLDNKITEPIIGNIRNVQLRELPAYESKEDLQRAILSKNYTELAKLWVRGETIDWTLLYANGKPAKISLPAYPFIKDRYWIPVTEQHVIQQQSDKLHPLLHNNESNLHEQLFTSIYSGKEAFLSASKIPNIKELSASALLELVREAGERSLRAKVTQMREVTWADPIRINGTPAKVNISVFPTGKDIAYSIYTHNKDGEEQVNGQGMLVIQQQPEPESLNIKEILSRQQRTIEKDAFYQLFSKMGIINNSSFMEIEALYYSETEALSKVSLHVVENFVLSPGILDSVVKICMGWLFDTGGRFIYRPAGAAEVTLYNPLSHVAWCHVVRRDRQKANNSTVCYDAELLDDQGNVLLRFKNLILEPENEQIEAAEQENVHFDAPCVYKPVWERVLITPSFSLRKGKHLIVAGNSMPSFAGELQQLLKEKGCEVEIVKNLEIVPLCIVSIYLLQGLFNLSKEVSPKNDYLQKEQAVFNSIQTLLRSPLKEQPLNLMVFTSNTQRVLTTEEVMASGSGIIGLTGTLLKEQPQWTVSRVDLESTDTNKIDWVSALMAGNNKDNDLICLRSGHSYRQRLYQVNLSTNKPSRFRNGGVYVLLGGAGGIGKTTTAYLVKNYNAQVIWLGRRPLDTTIITSQEEIGCLGVKPAYFQCDATSKQEVEQAYEAIKKVYKEVHGLFHSAIVLNDMLLKNMTEDDFKTVFEPKSLASHYLVDAFQSEPLDFICFYSSAQSLLQTPGQGNYAAGCSYKDSYALNLKHKLKAPAYIINWGYWGEVGIVAAPVFRERMELAGVGSITAEEGMRLLETVLSGDQEQVLAIKLNDTVITAIPSIINNVIIEPVYTNSIVRIEVLKIDALTKSDDADKAFLELCSKGILQVLLKMGLESKQQDNQSLHELRKALDISDTYEPLFFVIIKLLKEKHYLEEKGGRLFIKQDIQDFLLQNAVALITAEHKEYLPHGTLLSLCLNAFPEILTGKQQATEVMFPGGSLDYVSGIYQGNRQSDYFNTLLADIIKNSVANGIKQLQPGEKIRILEVGAGTGGTSNIVFKALAPYKDHLEYMYTDLSRSFLLYAEQHFKEIAPYLETGILNIEQPPVEQHMLAGNYDIVIGANVVHATKNMTVTLNNIKYLLKKDGLLLLNEIARTELFTTLTFGLLDGWWLYEDSDIRLSGSPGLSAVNWNTVLSETGYLNTQSLPAISGLSQQIVCAKSDGMIHTVPVKSKQTNMKINIDADKSIRYTEAQDSSWLTDTLINIAANLIKLPPQDFDVHTQFMDYGFDSILGMELIKNINEKLEVSLKPTDLFSYSSITQMTSYLQQTYPDKWRFETVVNTVRVLPITSQVTTPIIPAKKTRFTAETGNTTTSMVVENDIAIIGLSGQFGTAGNMDAFWQVLKEGKSLIGEIPADRWDGEVTSNASKWVGSFLNDIDKFDPMFFKISGSETEMMDPQQRVFLEHCWRAIEDAAINPRTLKGSKCGVYAGVSPSDYNIRESEEASVMWGNSSAILASRISYLLDLKGPAISVDTACSSSLVAMDMGCASLQKGDTDLIIAGGINIMTTSGFYTLASRAGMMSANGKCYTFDKRADGFVPGEGVGVVVLKRLSDAERDGDHIYGVIKASLTNQDGASNGITAPSVLSQQELEKEVYQKFNINPESISYVEAHGTGTSLGDPIELEALTAAFRTYTQKQQYCAIGSAKTNIGHTLEASGMAGVSKILLSLKHKQLPPSLNYEECNPLIDIINSPFKVQRDLGEWKTENNQPRRAAISGFGFSGTNVHMVIEEYIAPQKATQHNSGPAIIVLSAKNAERLKDQVNNLLNFIKSHPDDHLQDMAYTLQVGREAMEERLAIIARDKTELQKLLSEFLAGKNDQLIAGNIKKDKADYLLQGGAAQAYISYALKHQELKSIAALWVKGVDFNWNLLYPFNRPQRISLPTYAFARQRYWVSKQEKQVVQVNSDSLHPLLHSNTSNLKTLQFTSIFTGKESFLEHHKISTEKILPGVAYLEMARIAGCKLTTQQVTRLKNVSWLSPIHVNGKPATVNIRLQGAGDDVKYEIYTSATEDRIHNQGRISIQPAQAPPRLDLEGIKNRFTQSVDREKCYDIFRQIGLNYGSSFQGIERLYYSDNEALSKISLPKEGAFMLSPGLLDSTLQTCMGLSFGRKETSMELPFSVKEVTIYHELPETVWSYVRKSDLNNSDQITNYDVDIVGEQGDILVTFKNFVTLPAPGSVKAIKSDDNEGVLLFTSKWVDQPAVNPLQPEWDTMPMILLAGGSFQLAENLSATLEIEVKIISGETAEEALLNVLTIVKEKMKGKVASHILVLCSNEDYVEYGYISGFLKTAKIENAELSGKVLGVDSLSIKNVTDLTEILLAEQFTTDTEVRYEAGVRKIKQIQEIKVDDCDLVKIKPGGVYLIVGGAGGLGSVFTDYINKVPQTKVILIGRSELSEEKRAALAALSSAEYFKCDVSNKTEVVNLVRLIKEKYQRLDGVIHCAGVLRDGLIINKTADDVRQVLASKVTGIKNIDEATKEEAIDFIVFFSGIAATIGNIGQADYSAANAYMDNYAQYREAERVRGKRKGKTLSINWPFWKDGGMQINTDSITHLENNWGMLPLPSDAGTWAFEKLLGSIYSQGMVVYGHENKIRQKLLSEPVIKEKRIIRKSSEQTDIPGLKEVIAEKILEITAALLRLPVSDIEQDEKLSDYGFDSILLIKYSNEINDFYDIDLTPAIFYNYLTVNDLTQFLLEEYREKLLIRHPIKLDQEEVIAPVTKTQDMLQVIDPEHYPLSEGQKGLWFIQQLEPANINYNVPVSFIIPGNINERLIKESFRLLLEEHPLLRSSFRKDTLTGDVYNQINTVEQSLFFDYAEIDEQQDIKEMCWSLIRRPFNLEHDSPVRLFIRTKKSTQKNYILFVFHHIIFDGMSSAIFLASFFEKYQYLLTGKGTITANEPDFSYFSFAKWEQEFINSSKGAKCLTYWQQKLSGALPVLALPYDKPVKLNVSTTSIGSESIQIDQQEFQQLKTLCRTLDVNMPVMIAGIFNMLLHKLTGQEDLLILMPTVGRPRKEYEKSIGYYVNMMVVRNHVSAEMTFNELLRSIKNEFINGMSNAAYPLPRLLADLHIERSGGRETPLKVSFIYQSIFDGMSSEGGIPGIEIYDEVYQETAHIYSLDIQEMHKALIINLKYDDDMFYAATIRQHLGYFSQMLKEVMEDASKPLKAYEILSTEEIRHLLLERNESAAEYPKNKTLADLFDEQVLKTPQNLAVVHDGKRVTYQELNDMANRLANFLKKSGVPKNAPISIVSHKSLEQIWGVLGIAKAGCYYIPVKGGLPKNRINELIVQSESKVVLVQRDYLDKIDHSETVNVVVLEEALFSDEASTHETVKVSDTELAYIIFTSGSTGKPKGVMIDHRGVVNTLYDMNARFKITQNDKIFGISDLNFDLSVYDIFGVLACGAALILPLESERHHPDIWMKYVKDEGVTVWNSVPQIVNLLIDRQEETDDNLLTSLRLYFMSGDWIPLELPDRIKRINAHSEVFSLGGATEGSIWSIYFPIGEIDPLWKSIPYGYPLGNQEMYVLDVNLAPCPVNVPGDIYIGGIGVAKGYHKDPEKTAASFIDHPKLNKRLYRTGDLGFQHPGGYMMFLGRQDGQVKINGFRVELGEIETILQQSEFVKQCVVLTTDDAQRNKLLVAYVVVNDELNVITLQQYLRIYLPDYMVPSIFVEIDKIPLSSNGKVDRNALPSVDMSSVNTQQYEAARDEVEQELVAIWSQLLNGVQVGIHDDFFQVGGNSLTMIQLVHKINTRFNKDLQLIEIMKNPTIAQMKTLLDVVTKDQDSNASILTLREGSTQDASFIIPGALGSTDGYYHLATNLPGQGAVYGLQMKGLNGKEEPNSSIQEMAAHNLALIKSINPIGKISLLAHSYGGIVIYEMLKQAALIAIEVDEVILLDCFVDPLLSFHALSELDKLGTYFRALLKFSQPELDEEEAEFIITCMGQSDADKRMEFICDIVNTLPANLIIQMWKVFYASVSASYKMTEKLDYAITFVQADNSQLSGEDWGEEGSAAGWDQYFSIIKLMNTEANHFTIVNEPHCTEWLTKINNEQILSAI